MGDKFSSVITGTSLYRTLLIITTSCIVYFLTGIHDDIKEIQKSLKSVLISSAVTDTRVRILETQVNSNISADLKSFDRRIRHLEGLR